MDESETAVIATSHVTGPMNYPSTTQALFALIVMIIVLLFILVYCCWGTFSCARPHQEDVTAPVTEDGGGSNGQGGVRHIIRGPHTVIVPINNMIYVGDPETRQIYQIPLDRDKPPAYTEIYRGPPPPYRPDTAASTSEVTNNATTPRQGDNNRVALPESPPAYNECLSGRSEETAAAGQSSSVASDPLSQQPQGGTAEPDMPTDTPATSVTENPALPPSESSQEVQESSLQAGVVLTVNTLPQPVPQPLSQKTEERPSDVTRVPDAT